jgi:hypothetical protein
MANTIQYDIWAVTPDSNDEYFRSSATISASGSVSLLNNDMGYNGTGYKVSITSNGAESGTLFTITGVKVGAVGYDGVVTEVVNGPSATVVYSTNYYTRINSISVSAASNGGVKIGYGGDLAFPRTRIKGLSYLSVATAGTITFTAQPANRVILKINTPANSTGAHDLIIPPEGVLTTKGSQNDYAVMSLSQVSDVTVLCG